MARGGRCDRHRHLARPRRHRRRQVRRAGRIGIIHQASIAMSTTTVRGAGAAEGGPAGKKMTGEEMVALSKKHTISEWAVQGAVDPIPVERAEGIYFYTPEGKRFIDFNSQLMSVNIGHSDPRVVKAIQEQVAKLCYVTPGGMTTEPRAKLGAKLGELA